MIISSLGLWGLDKNGDFLQGSGDKKSLLQKYSSWTSLQSEVPNVRNIVLFELHKVAAKVRKEWSTMESTAIGDRAKAKHLLFLFQCDLLPGISGQILSSKGARDSSSTRSVSVRQKLLGYLFVFLANAGMLFYIFLFALQQTKFRQNAWLQSFLLWLLTETLFISTIVVFVIQFVVPSLIMKDIGKLKHKIASIMREFQENSGTAVAAADRSSSFNAAEFLFVSTHLAKQLPHLQVAKMIATFSTPWPRQSYQHVRDVSKSYNKGVSYALGSFSGILLFMLGTFINIPEMAQDAFVHVVAGALVGYTVLLHTQLFNLFPAFAFLPLFFCCVVAHFLVRSAKRRFVSKIQAQMPRVATDELNHKDGPRRRDRIDSIHNLDDSKNCGNDQRKHINRRMSLVQGLTLIHNANKSNIDSKEQFNNSIDSTDINVRIRSEDSYDISEYLSEEDESVSPNRISSISIDSVSSSDSYSYESPDTVSTSSTQSVVSVNISTTLEEDTTTTSCEDGRDSSEISFSESTDSSYK